MFVLLFFLTCYFLSFDKYVLFVWSTPSTLALHQVSYLRTNLTRIKGPANASFSFCQVFIFATRGCYYNAPSLYSDFNLVKFHQFWRSKSQFDRHRLWPSQRPRTSNQVILRDALWCPSTAHSVILILAFTNLLTSKFLMIMRFWWIFVAAFSITVCLGTGGPGQQRWLCQTGTFFSPVLHLSFCTNLSA